MLGCLDQTLSPIGRRENLLINWFSRANNNRQMDVTSVLNLGQCMALREVAKFAKASTHNFYLVKDRMHTNRRS